jgi:uncharacterized protein
MIQETRAFDLSTTEVREEKSGFHFRGYAAIFNTLSADLGGFKETILPGAFKRTLSENRDIRFLVNHDPTKILGRTPRTLSVHEDTRGLAVDAQLPNTSYGKDLAESLSRGDISQMSFRFKARDDEWEQRDEGTIRKLKDVDLVEVSAVTFPAYDAAEARLEERMLQTAVKAMEEVREGKALSNSNRDALMSIMNQIAELLEVNDARSLETNPIKLKLALREREFTF